MLNPILARIKNANYVAKMVHMVVGVFTYPGIALINKIKITGTENIDKLPKRNILFVSNHQTYFMDVITLYHIFSAVKWGKKNKLGLPYYMLNPFTKVNYVAAEQTMKTNWMTRLFMLAGGLTVRRTWNEASKEKRSGLDPSDTRKAFNKTGVLIKQKGTQLTVTFKKPLEIDYDASAEDITRQLMDAIEQSKTFMPDALKQEP